ncbi:S4 domain-containing protein [Hyphomicrobium sp. D-2]|uniref:S4 domain-containing protein n=1 Tax=Hyphomicrobium sp. D-2 TaxID=3041621 RepID=UPI002457BE3B|nr:S4 domain-containing protein [Hyphomicrobium sp. D-2]MDH4981025.1 S4 domain-containing protein [Hyphomicrobium sp. D-2]
MPGSRSHPAFVNFFACRDAAPQGASLAMSHRPFSGRAAGHQSSIARGAGTPSPRAALSSKPSRARFSKLGFCSRTEATVLIEAGRVSVNGRTARVATLRVDPDRDRITVDGGAIAAEAKIYLMLNKPRGFVTTRGATRTSGDSRRSVLPPDLPFLSSSRRSSRQGERSGLLLLTNDSRLGRITRLISASWRSENLSRKNRPGRR